jgi:hypothetical protein
MRTEVGGNQSSLTRKYPTQIAEGKYSNVYL